MDAMPKIKYAVWIPYGRNDSKCVDNPEWWKLRTSAMHRITLQSLKNQTYKDFEIWIAVMSDLVDRGKYMIDFVKTNYPDIKIVIDPRNCPGKAKPYSPEPYECICSYFDYDTDYVCIVRIDSDDAFMPMALDRVKKAPHRDGLVGYFGGGYVIAPELNSYAEYHPTNPMAYASMTYGREILNGRTEFEAYREKYKMNLFHHQMKRAKHAHDYGDGLIVQHDCGGNVVCSWEHYKKKGNIGRDLTSSEIESLKKITGIIA
jgi:hypothetical protein